MKLPQPKSLNGLILVGFGLVALPLLIAGFWAVSLHPEPLQYRLAIPVVSGLLNLGIIFLPFAMLVIVGSANAVNLTDGLDGLAIMPVMIAAGYCQRIVHRGLPSLYRSQAQSLFLCRQRVV